MYAITGASGNTGSVVASTLLDSGKKVRVIGRNANHLRPFADRGAEVFVADLSDTAQLVRAFSGAEAVYAMIPPDPAAPDVLGYEDRVAKSLASALADAKVRYAVTLSSVGADKPSGTGLILGLHHLEQTLDRVSALNLLHLRAGYFMENTLAQAGAIQKMGYAVGPITPSLKLPMIAARDIGAAAAQAMLHLDFNGHQSHELLGQRDISYPEAMSIVGKVIGKPDLQYTQLPDAQVRATVTQMGMSPNFADLLLEMSAGLNSGYIKPLEPRTAANTTPTSYETFVAEKFVPAYSQAAKAA
jgi:uncharacterized protein YbjT (DUF2867 family)